MKKIDLRGKSFLKLQDFSHDEIRYLLDLAIKLKKDKKASKEKQFLKNKNIALIFEKSSTRTRCAFEVGAHDQGASTTYLGPVGSHMGKKETARDTARVLGRMYDGIEYRGFGQDIVQELSDYANVPVWNGLTNEFHPTQVLADLLTIEEKFGKLEGIKFAFVGDGRSNTANSLMIGCAKMGLDFRIVAPKKLHPSKELIKNAKKIAKENNGKILITSDISEGVKGINVIYTDVWVSMGEPEKIWNERIKLLKKYSVSVALMKMADKNAIFMHCLPAFHNTDTIVGKEIKKKYKLNCMEVTDDVFESKQSVVFDEAENRLHTIKAVMVATLKKR